MSNTTPVTINVPTDLVLDFQDAAHEVLTRLRQGLSPCPSAETEPDTNRQPTRFSPLDPTRARHLDVHSLTAWGTGTDDAERARWVVGDLHEDQVAIVASMARHAGERIRGDVIAAETNYDGPRSVAPAMRGLAQRCRRASRGPFWVFHRESTSGQGTYEMTERVADLFGRALDELQPGWRERPFDDNPGAR